MTYFLCLFDSYSRNFDSNDWTTTLLELWLFSLILEKFDPLNQDSATVAQK